MVLALNESYVLEVSTVLSIVLLEIVQLVLNFVLSETHLVSAMNLKTPERMFYQPTTSMLYVGKSEPGPHKSPKYLQIVK